MKMKQQCNILPRNPKNEMYVKGNKVMNLPPWVKESPPETRISFINNQLLWNQKHKDTMSKVPFLVCDKELEKTGYGLNCVDDDQVLDRISSPFYDAEKFDTTEDFFACDESDKYGAFDRITVIPETNTVVRFTTETYDLEEGLAVLDELRKKRFALKEGQGLVEPKEVA